MAHADRSFRISIVTATLDGGAPPSGEVQLVGTNTLYGLIAANPARLAGFTTHNFGYALCGAYGGGAFVPNFGPAGSYVLVNASGDSAPQVWDAAVFDFATLTWSLQANADGIPNSPVTQWCTDINGHTGTTTGAPYFELIGHPGVPHAAQHYRLAVGVGTRFIRTCGSFMGGDLKTTLYTHQYDLSSAKYSRLSTNAMTPNEFNWAVEPAALLDVRMNRIWFIDAELAYATYLPYLDLADNTWKKSASFATPPVSGQTGNWQHSLLHDDGVRRCILVFKSTFYQGQTYPNFAKVLDLDDIAGGWKSVTLTGPTTQFQWPGGGPSSESHAVRWAQYPKDNCHYTYVGRGGKVSKITPPTGPITGEWTISELTPINAATSPLPDKMNGGGAAEGTADFLSHYTRWMYVPALGCFAWIAGGDKQVALWTP